MKWRGRQRSANVEDRRGRGGLVAGGGIGAVVLGLIVFLMGGDPGEVVQGGGGAGGAPPADPAADTLAQMTEVVFRDTEDVWNDIFRQEGGAYREPTLVLYSGGTSSGCGFAQAAVGPFYCPQDGRVYIDLSFFGDMRRRLDAPGDFAQAYVVAHEVGHHVQTLLGISQRVSEAQRSLGREEGNRMSVRLELQADCLAGVWANHAQQRWDILEPGDVEEALNAASAIGDDRLQRQSQGYVVPESFTHGSSAQRVRWFRQGLASGDPDTCDTFAAGAV